MDVAYFKITGGHIREAFDRLCKERASARVEIEKLALSVGATLDRTYATRTGVLAFKFDGQAGAEKPHGWVGVKRCEWGCAPGKHKKFADLRKAMKDLRYPDNYDFLKWISGKDPGSCILEMSYYTAAAGYEHIKPGIDVLSLSIRPEGVNTKEWDPWWLPEENEFCVRLRMSEYWALKESKEPKTEKP